MASKEGKAPMQAQSKIHRTLYFGVEERDHESTEEVYVKINDENDFCTVLRVFTTPELASKIRAQDEATINEILGCQSKEAETSTRGEDTPTTSRSTSPTTFNSPTSVTKSWTKCAEQNLLNLYKEVENSKKPVKSKWMLISKELQSIDQYYEYSAEQCRLKIKSLKERHGKLKRKLNKSGTENPNDPLEDEMEDAFGTQQDIHPSYTLESAAKLSSTDESTSTNSSCPPQSTPSKPKFTKTDKDEGNDASSRSTLSKNKQSKRKKAEKERIYF